jgi:hypothetical protein
LTLEILTGINAGKSYFQEHDVLTYKAMRSYMNYVKINLLEPYSGLDFVIDLASGKGQDIGKYRMNKIQALLCLEKDKDALNELISRKYTSKQNMCVSPTEATSSMIIYTAQMDLNDKYSDNITILKDELKLPIPINGSKLIVCNLAFHYFLEDKRSIDNIVDMVDSLLANGGTFYYTALDGRQVFNLLQEHKGHWEVKENGSVKYSIKCDLFKKSKNGVLVPGMEIKVLLPFSSGDYYTEFLVDGDYVEKQFIKKKYSKTLYECFNTMFERYKRDDHNNYKSLTDNDITWISLFYFTAFTKNVKRVVKK